MKVKFDKESHSLIIKDGLREHFMILKFIFILNLINSGLYLYKSYKSDSFSGFDWVWLILGILSIGSLIFTFTRSTQEIVQNGEISCLFKRNYFGSDRYYLKLKNGKIRNLPFVKTGDELELRNILKEAEIRNKLAK